MNGSRKKIYVLGTKGLPGLQGGIESHAEALYPRLAGLGYEVTVFCRGCYFPPADRVSGFGGVHLRYSATPHSKNFEAIISTLNGVFRCVLERPDIVHLHAVGPSLLIPLLRLFGLKVVMTHHGFDYQRNKWGPFARIMLRLGEYVGSRSAHQVICVAGGLKKTLVQKGADAQRIHVIYNGIEPVSPITGTDYISSLGLEPGKYIMAAARFVEEKGLHDLVQAYARLGTTNYKLVLAGNADHPTDYAQKLQADAARCPGVALPGYVEGRVLQELFSHARLCVLPSYLEGLPVTLLEAMSYQRDILSSNTGGSHELGLEAGDYFVAGDVEDLVRGLKRKLESPPRSTPYPQLEESQFNWDHIAKATAQIYDAL